jgi:hypothetical protein
MAKKTKRAAKTAAKSKPKKSAREVTPKKKRKKSSGGSSKAGKPVRRAAEATHKKPRARSSAGKPTPKSKAQRAKLAAARKVEAARKRKNDRARARREEMREAERIAREHKKPQDERETLDDILADMTPAGFYFELTEPEVASQMRMPFLSVGKYTPTESIGYAELHAVFRRWRDDLLLEAAINPQRISSIRIVYEDPADKRGSGDSVVSHAGPWELVISEIAHEVDPSDEDSLATRYADSVVPHFYVYFAAQIARGSSWIPHYQRD